MALLTIGEFAERSRLSPKALRIYDQLGVVVPVQVDPGSGYRLYEESQVRQARLVGNLRRLDMPLAMIADLLALDGVTAASALDEWWGTVETATGQHRELVTYLRAQLKGEEPPMRDVELRTIPERMVLSITRHVTTATTDAFFDDAFSRLRGAGPGVENIAGAPYLVFYGEVSDDSDGPIELCRPVLAENLPDAPAPGSDMQTRTEPAHDEAYVRLSLGEMRWPAMLPFLDVVERWVRDQGRQPRAPFRQVLIADQRSAGPTTLVCDLSLPLR